MLRWLLDWIFSRGYGLDELARRLDLPVEDIVRVNRDYHEFTIRKKSGKRRSIAAPNPELKKLQRRILRRLLAKLKTHPQATGFQPGVSFVDNARCHQSQQVVIKVDLIHFFPSIRRERVEAYFRLIGWNRKAARTLTDLTTYNSALPQGSPTSPRLSNLVNYGLDVRLASLASQYNGVYTRYADDITISMSQSGGNIHDSIQGLFRIIREHGYLPHVSRKFDVRRSHQRQVVTGLVVNDRANLPRETRRWLRAVEYRTRNQGVGGKFTPAPTLTRQQLQGWRGLRKMVDGQSI